MMWSRSPENASRLKTRLNGRATELVSSTVSVSKVPKVYSWIEFPAWAWTIRELNDLIDLAYKRAKERDNFGGAIRLSDMVPNGRFSDLEAKFQEFHVPYDCGGQAPGDRIPWNGWWRVGYRYSVQYEVSSIGEQFVSLDDLRDVLGKYEGTTPLYAALRELIKKNDHSPPVALRDTNATYSIARLDDTRPSFFRKALTDVIQSPIKVKVSLRRWRNIPRETKKAKVM